MTVKTGFGDFSTALTSSLNSLRKRVGNMISDNIDMEEEQDMALAGTDGPEFSIFRLGREVGYAQITITLCSLTPFKNLELCLPQRNMWSVQGYVSQTHSAIHTIHLDHFSSNHPSLAALTQNLSIITLQVCFPHGL